MSITIKGTVREGNKVGRKIGFPTANIPLDPLVKIDDGVYVVEFTVDGYRYHGVANIGVHPTVGRNSKRLIEVNVFDYNDSLYGKEVEVCLLHYIREEKNFATRDELIQAIGSDVEFAKNYFRKR